MCGGGDRAARRHHCLRAFSKVREAWPLGVLCLAGKLLTLRPGSQSQVQTVDEGAGRPLGRQPLEWADRNRWCPMNTAGRATDSRQVALCHITRTSVPSAKVALSVSPPFCKSSKSLMGVTALFPVASRIVEYNSDGA